MKINKTIAVILSFFLLLNLFFADAVRAADYSEEDTNNAAVVETEIESELTSQLEIWGTLAEAKIGYGLQYTYGCVGYNAGGGYFICYCLKSDNSTIYFGCYSL